VAPSPGPDDQPTDGPEPALATRQRLLDAAVEVFLTNGYARTRVQDIAREAGLTTGAMYAHFENKADLLSAAIAQQGELALQELVEAMGAEPLGLLGITAGVSTIAGAPRPGHRLMLEALAVSAREGDNADVIGPTLTRMHDTIAAQVEAGRAAGIVDESMDTEALVAVFQRLVLGSIVAKAIGLDAPDPRAVEHVVASMLVSLLPGPPAEP